MILIQEQTLLDQILHFNRSLSGLLGRCLHYDIAHFDLIFSKHCRLAENVLPRSRNEEDGKKLVDLKEKYEKLKIAYTERLMKIEKLKT